MHEDTRPLGLSNNLQKDCVTSPPPLPSPPFPTLPLPHRDPVLIYIYQIFSQRYSIISSNELGFQISFNLLFGMAFLASSFVVFLVQERTNKAKHVQFVSGVDPISYWSSAYTWDMINFFVPALSILVLIAAFDVPAYMGL